MLCDFLDQFFTWVLTVGGQYFGLGWVYDVLVAWTEALQSFFV